MDGEISRMRGFDSAGFVRHLLARMRALQNCARRIPHSANLTTPPLRGR